MGITDGAKSVAGKAAHGTKAAAVAVAAYRAERHHRGDNGAAKTSGPSAWVSQHRARLGRGPRA